VDSENATIPPEVLSTESEAVALAEETIALQRQLLALQRDLIGELRAHIAAATATGDSLQARMAFLEDRLRVHRWEKKAAEFRDAAAPLLIRTETEEEH
jgi:uncharacterized coiled-coil protein SlyX